MSKYKFHIDKPLPDSDQVNRHQDFERLYGRYESATRFGFWRKLLRKPRFFGSVVLLGVILWLVFDAGKKDDAPFIDPQLNFSPAIIQTDSCTTQLFDNLAKIYGYGIPLSWKENEEQFYMETQRIVITHACSQSPAVANQAAGDQLFNLDIKEKKWVPFNPQEQSVADKILLVGKKQHKAPDYDRKLRLYTPDGENLSRRLGKKDRTAFLIWNERKTIIPLRYDGAGKHILPFMPTGKAAIWAVDDQGIWWEVDEINFQNWQQSSEIDIFVSKTDADKRLLGQ